MEHVRVDVMAATPRKGASKKITPSTLKPGGKAEKGVKADKADRVDKAEKVAPVKKSAIKKAVTPVGTSSAVAPVKAKKASAAVPVPLFQAPPKAKSAVKKVSAVATKDGSDASAQSEPAEKLKAVPNAHEVVVRAEVAAVVDVVVDAMKKIKLRVIQQVQIQMRKIQKVEFIVVDVAE